MRKTNIGIVMLTDEREHVHTQTDAQNMEVVQKWANVIKEDGKTFDGETYDVVIGKEIIYDIRTAQDVGKQLSEADCKQIIFCYNVWNFPFLVWPTLNTLGKDVPVLSLSNNNGKFPGNVGLLATDGALRQAGKRTHRIIGELDDPVTRRKVIDWVRASQAVTTIRNEVYGCYGGHSMGMETGFSHLTPTLKALGTTIRQIDQLWLMKQMDRIDEAEVDKGLAWFEKLLGDRLKYDGKMLTKETLKTQIRLYLSMELVNQEKGFDFCGLKGQRELTEYVCLGDVPEMLMNDPYDWRGPKEPFVCATEADTYAAITMQLLKYASGGLPTLFMDVRLYHPDRDLWDFCNSGNHATYYAARSKNAEENFKAVSFHPALEFYFKAGGASVEFDAAPGTLTFARLGLFDEKPYMVIIPGEVVSLKEKVRKELNAKTDPTWPHVHAKLDCAFEEFVNLFPCNHIQAVEGDAVDALVYLCEITGIVPVVLGPRGAQRVKPIWERV
ncbi:fucose isomerase [candidate division KSB1 bacterium]|nr:fucose isomerase [candidate division KSB1 bacterium]